MPQPRLSIVIPCFISTAAQADLLNETLGTVVRQTSTDYEVILVDDGSPIAVKGIVDRVPPAQVLWQPNGGSALARNTGIARARGEFIIFLDADDHLLPQAVATGIRMLEQHREAGFAVGPREEMTFEGHDVSWSVPPPPADTDIYRSLLAFDWYIIPPSSAIFRRSVVEEVGGFQNPWGADDLDFYLRVARRHRAWCYQEPAVTRYRRYSTSSSRDGARMLQSIRAVYARQWPIVQGNSALEAAYHHGLSALTEIFLDCVVENIEDRVRAGARHAALRSAQLLVEESPARWRALVAGGTPEIAALAGDLERHRRRVS